MTDETKVVDADKSYTITDLYDAYLLGCEDECIPEPKTLKQFDEMWHAGWAVTKFPVRYPDDVIDELMKRSRGGK